MMFLLLLMKITFVLSASHSFRISSTSAHRVLELLYAQQVEFSSPYFPPLSQAQQKGLFKSAVHVNTVESSFVRRNAKIDDLNPFVSMFVVTQLMELQQLSDLQKNKTMAMREKKKKNHPQGVMKKGHDDDEKVQSDAGMHAKFGRKEDNNDSVWLEGDDFFSVNQTVLSMALDAIATYHDNNHPNSTPAISFWPRKKIIFSSDPLKKNLTLWEAYPPNLFGPVEFFGSMSKFIEHFFADLGLRFFSHLAEEVAHSLETLVDAFRIPSDFDDTGCNMAMGGWLKKMAKTEKNNSSSFFAHHFQQWQLRNGNVLNVMKLAAKYGYKPLSQNSSDMSNILDPRSYYAFHPFLESLAKNAKNAKNVKKGVLSDEPIIVSTWIMDIDETRADFGAVEMPFCVNNVDLSVASNFVYGSLHALIFNLNDAAQIMFGEKTTSQNAQLNFVHMSPQDINSIVSLLNTTTHLLSWAIEQNVPFLRPDIAMLYYPSTFDFYWMSARIFRLLDDHHQTQDPNLPKKLQNFLDPLRLRLGHALQTEATRQLLQMAKWEQKNLSSFCEAYFDDFLGDYGGKSRGDDRIFSTSLAAKTLMDIWTVFSTGTSNATNNGGVRQWLLETPETVKQLVECSVRFIAKLYSGSAKEGKENPYVPMCAFFSGSFKGLSSDPWIYPGNWAQLRNGTHLDPLGPFPSHTQQAAEMSYGMRGVVNEFVYQQMLQQKFFGNNQTAPRNMTNFNAKGSSWPFWSSNAITYATSLLAMANWNSLQ